MSSWRDSVKVSPMPEPPAQDLPGDRYYGEGPLKRKRTPEEIDKKEKKDRKRVAKEHPGDYR